MWKHSITWLYAISIVAGVPPPNIYSADGFGLEGSLPAEIGFLTHLTVLNISWFGEGLGGEIPDLSRLTKLEELRLVGNSLTGTIPTTLGLLTSLNSFDVAENELSGPISTELGTLLSLEQLHLEVNNLQGSLPNLSRLSKLEDLRLYTNGLTGSIPSTLPRTHDIADLLERCGKRIVGSDSNRVGGFVVALRAPSRK
jgi:hypothetical protein